MRLSSDILQQSSRDDADPFDLAEGLQKGAMELINAIARKEAKSVSALMPEYLKHLITISEKTPGLTGLPSGFANLDVRLGGFKPGKLYVVAGRPAMGKTAYVLNLLMNAAKLSKRPVAIFTLEMDDQETISRLLSTESGVDSKKITDGELDSAEWARINKATGALERVKFFIDDTSGLKMFELRAKARRLVAKEGVAMIAIDYLQLMSGDGKNHNREQQISEISRGLKTLAMELKIPVIALSQLSRSVESRGGDKRPQLQDLRESGSIEQDADTVSFLYRPEYYGIERKSDGSSTKGLVEVIHKKHRAGEPGTDQLYFRPNASLFTEFDNQHGKEEMPFYRR
jgi:replicative DNA helicase